MFNNIKINEIKSDKSLSTSFKSAKFANLDFNCNIFTGNFYLDSFNYFLINENHQTFIDLFRRDNSQNLSHFFTNDFYKIFIENKKDYKVFDNIYVLGSNAADNYYSNLIHFLPRIFFNKEKNIKIAIHRNSSNKFRTLIDQICNNQKINHTFLYLDDDFYKFTNSQFPQFLNIKNSIDILKSFLKSSPANSLEKKIYITRENSNYRRIVNEFDIVPILKKNGFKIINPHLYEITEQIKIFSEADTIISAHGSNLSNIVFCKPGTKIYEIIPKSNKDYELIFSEKYKKIAEINKLDFIQITADTVDIKDHSKYVSKYINKTILNESSYYKDLIVKIDEFKKIT